MPSATTAGYAAKRIAERLGLDDDVAWCETASQFNVLYCKNPLKFVASQIQAGVAQWQSSGFVNRRSRVRLPSPAPFFRHELGPESFATMSACSF